MGRTSGEDTDLFVGKNKILTLTLVNGTETRFRDVVVLGELIIRSSNPENTAVKPRLAARDFFAPAILSTTNINIRCINFYQPKNTEAFRRELQELFLEWLHIQKESAKQIGLKSIAI